MRERQKKIIKLSVVRLAYSESMGAYKVVEVNVYLENGRQFEGKGEILSSVGQRIVRQ